MTEITPKGFTSYHDCFRVLTNSHYLHKYPDLSNTEYSSKNGVYTVGPWEKQLENRPEGNGERVCFLYVLSFALLSLGCLVLCFCFNDSASLTCPRETRTNVFLSQKDNNNRSTYASHQRLLWWTNIHFQSTIEGSPQSPTPSRMRT